MSEWVQLVNTAGVAVAVLVAVGFAIWRAFVFIGKKAFGDDSKNPPVKGFVNAWLENQKEFHKSLQSHSERQIQLCDRHATSLETISGLLGTHDTYAKVRTTGIANLEALHTDARIPGSTAEAIVHVGQLRKAARAACLGCREAAASKPENVRDVILKHCDDIERIFDLTEPKQV